MDKVDIKYQLNKKDLVAMRRNDFLVALVDKYSIIGYIVFCLMVSIYTFTVLNDMSFWGIWGARYLLKPLLIIFGYIVIIYLFRFFGISNAVEREMRNSQYYTNEYNWEITTEGLVRVFPHGQYITYWNDVYKVEEKNKYYNIYVTKVQRAWVPKTVFQNEEELAFAKECFSKAVKGGRQNG